VISGGETDVCVLAAVMDAVDAGYRVVLAADALCSVSDESHDEYDAVLAFGEVLRQRYLKRGWGRQVFTWHEAADTRLFFPRIADSDPLDLVWIGNWGDGERAQELEEFLIEPARRLQLTGTVRGVRYPDSALAALRRTSLEYSGWIANANVPDAFARHLMTVHVPRRPYAVTLPGIPTIRVFEALACGIPLVCAPWRDEEALFRSGDFLLARNADAMTAQLELLLRDRDFARSLAAGGLETIRQPEQVERFRQALAAPADRLYWLLPVAYT
jgi:spore maturation protein CgeB